MGQTNKEIKEINSTANNPISHMDIHKITIRGARTHNLKNISLTLPRNKLIVITGLSGSGKSSLAFDTLYAEGQRRYVESLSAYARQFLSLMEKPDVDLIEGLSPAISIEQKSTSHNPRSTVGTITEIYDYLRLLFARIGEPKCPTHGLTLAAQTISQMVDHVLSLPEGTKLMLLSPVVRERKGEYLDLIENLKSQGYIRARVNGEITELSQIKALDRHKKHTIEVMIDRFKIRPDLQTRLAESFETALKLSGGLALIAPMHEDAPTTVPSPDSAQLEGVPVFEEKLFSANYACHECGYSLKELEPRLFSFNSPVGACPTCEGLGLKESFDEDKLIYPELTLSQGAIKGWNKAHVYYYNMLVSVTSHYQISMDTPFKDIPKEHQNILLRGSRGEKIALHTFGTKIAQMPFEGVIPYTKRRYEEAETAIIREELSKLLSEKTCPDCDGHRLNLSATHVFVGGKNLPAVTGLTIEEAQSFFETLELSGQRAQIAEKILKEIIQRFSFLNNVGLNYLTLQRKAETLSGGEAQRIRLASQIGAGLVGVMYILDEPSIGLHQRDNDRLLKTLTHLRDIGNTVIMVEHDMDAILMADHIVDIGPGAGEHGGQVIAQGTAQEIMDCPESLTGKYLSGKALIEVPKKRKAFANQPYLKLIGATGNNLQNVTLEIPLGLLTCVTGVSGSGKSTLINRTLYPIAATALNGAEVLKSDPYQSIEGLEKLDKVVDIDQSPIGRTPRSNPATYTGIFTAIRDLFTATAEARIRGYKVGRFSFNTKGGRCEACEGDGVIKVEMHFLADIYVSCDECQGKRYNRETLEVTYKGKNIYEVLEMTIEEAHAFFENIPTIQRKCQTLIEVGLSYIRLGQRATTLSGGEAQRVKLAKELSKKDTGQTLYILDEPTTGLHFHDIKQLLKVLFDLRDRGNTLLVIEHNLDVIKTADWIVDMGPEGGNKGGQIIAIGTPETIANQEHSHTGKFLKKLL
jgi:excinuclease ABC subunit A